jgi:hypothetical protein
MVPLALYPLGAETGWGTFGFEASEADWGGQHSVSDVCQYRNLAGSRRTVRHGGRVADVGR